MRTQMAQEGKHAQHDQQGTPAASPSAELQIQNAAKMKR
jgi:hypothetical protein